jgi:alcohol dehydrogenase (NADP+)
MVHGSNTWTDFKKEEHELKPFGDLDVDVAIDACGMCGSDIHTITGGWGEQPFPLCVGHEIIGKAVRVGPKVSLVKQGQRVGVGAQIYSCNDCKQCKNNNENYCRHQLNTYGSKWPDSGVMSQGGFGAYIRLPEHWVIPVPDKLDTANAAPMLCAGITAYSPLVRHGCGPGKKVGIVGLGGIGHYGLLWAKALGAETWCISRSRAKEKDAKALGADGYIATEEKDWAKPHEFTFDMILCTANSNKGWKIEEYFSLLDIQGRWIVVGLPDDAVPLKPPMFFPNGMLTGATHIGSRKETIEMLELAANRGIKSWVESVPLSAENLSKTVQRLYKNDVRYRFTMTDYDAVFGKRG